MKSIPLFKKTLVSTAISAMLASGVGHAGAFSLYTEGSGAGIGNFAAGAAAEASSAATGWYNPAGLAFLDKEQFVLSGVGVFPSTPLTGSSTFNTFTPIQYPLYVQNFSGLDGAKDALVPAFHYARPLGNRATFGLSVVSPFGLSTEYSNSSPVRYGATLSELMTINVSPELGGKLTDHLAIGVGFDMQYSKVKFNRIVGSPALLQANDLPPTFLDTNSYNEGDSFGFGYHAGILGEFNHGHTRVGLNYQSRVSHRFRGHSEFTGRFADPFSVIGDPTTQLRSDALFSNRIELPDVVTLSAYQDVNDRIALLGSVVYTGWDVFKTIQLNNVAAVTPNGPGFVDSDSPTNYNNAWRFALGANIKVNERFMMRVGGGYDETPTVDAERDVRLPDADRWALSAGAHYQMKPQLGFDLGYTYLFARHDTTVNRTEALGTTSTYNVTARTKPDAHLLGLQAVWTMDQGIAKTTK